MKAQRLLYWVNLTVIAALLCLTLPASIYAATTTTTTTPAASGSITLVPSSGSAGQTILISGSYFTNDGNVASVTFGSTSVIMNNADITGGAFSTYFTVPPMPKAVYTVTVASDSSNSASASFTILPRMTLATAAGQAGDQIVVNGDGFTASSKTSIFWDYATTALSTGSATSSGVISGLAAEVPETSAGSHLVRLVDASGNTVSANYTVKPIMTVDPVTVASGGETYVSGSGFAPSSQISIDLDNRLITSYVNTDSKGTLPATRLDIPSVSAGSHIITVTDGSHNYAKYTVNASCSISVNPRGGLIGSQVTVTGCGFLPSRAITLEYNGNPNLSADGQWRTNGDGSFSATFSVPNTQAGTYAIKATDGINTGSGQFMATASSGLEINSGIVGATIPVSGIGFTAGNTINIKFDGVGIARTSVDASGSFSTTFQVPPRGGGLHKIILTDGINPVSYNFTILPTAQISNANASGTQINGYLGSDITVSGNAFTPGALVSVHYDAREAAGPTVNDDGTFTATFEAPPSRPGKHSVTVTEGTNQYTFAFIMESTAPAVPMPISPIKDSRNEGLPKFQWSGVSDPSGVTYMLQIASEPSFSIPVIQKNDLTVPAYQITEDELLAANKKSQPYYWRVKAVDGVFNESQWSAAYTFGVGRDLPVWIWYACAGAAAIVVLAGGYFVGKKWPSIIPNLLGKVKTLRIPLPKFKKKE